MWGKANSLAVSNIWLIDNETPFKGISANWARCVGVSQDNLGRYVWRFGDDFKGSPLETVLDSIAEQKQVLKEPPICFYWNPRCGSRTFTRIRATNRHSVFFWSDASAQPPKTAYCGRFGNLDRRQIKELGPAVTSILYFLHPTAFPPINTALLNGFYALFSDKKKLGSWSNYLDMRQLIIESNAQIGSVLSKDLGAFAGLLFDIGSGGRHLIQSAGQETQIVPTAMIRDHRPSNGTFDATRIRLVAQSGTFRSDDIRRGTKLPSSRCRSRFHGRIPIELRRQSAPTLF